MTIGSDIINNLGIGSGIQSNTIVSQLSAIERAPRQDRIDTKRDLYETQLSDYGVLKSALASLQDAADQLADPNTFSSKTATYNDSTILVPQILDESAATGSYAFKVTQMARAHSLSISDANAFADPTDSVGKGVINISFGEWVDTDNFTVNADREALSITIDDTNNSLLGLKEAINDADAGIQANIVNDGVNGYKLVITGPSGLQNQLKISVSEDGATPTNTDNQGLSRFAFVEGAANRQLSQLQAGKNALFSVNGLDLVRSTNKIEDVVEGFTFTLAEEGTGETFTIDIGEDKLAAEEAIRNFVDTFNGFFEDTQPLLGFTEGEDGADGQFGSLYRDPTARALMSSLRSVIAQGVTALDGDFTTLTNVGIRTKIDGTLEINEKDFRAAIDDNFAAVRELFTPRTQSSSDKVVVNSFGSGTQAGEYALNITTQAAQGFTTGAAITNNPLASLTTPTAGFLTGSTIAGTLLTDLQTAGLTDYDFTLTVDGVTSGTVSLLQGTYTETQLATHLTNQINADATLAGAGKTVTVTWDIDHFVVTSSSAGETSSVTGFTAVGLKAGDLGLVGGTETAGANSSGDYSFSVNVNGILSDTINLLPGSYADYDELAQHLQSQINGDAKLKAGNAEVTVIWNTDHFVVTSNQYGAKSKVQFTDIGAQAFELGLEAGNNTNGVDVSGSLDGTAGFGVGNVFLPKLNTPASGLSFLISEGATSATINFSRGFGEQFSNLIDSYLENGGIFATKEESLNRNLTTLDEEEKSLDRRMEAFTARMAAQFLAMERILNSLNSTGSFLDGILDRLPLTQQQNR